MLVVGRHTYFFLRSPRGVDSDAMPGLRVGAAHVAGNYIVDTPAQYAAADAATVEASLRATRGTPAKADNAGDLRPRRMSAQEAPVEDPAALLARMFVFGGRLVFF